MSSDQNLVTRRVNGAMLQQSVGTLVCLVGKVIESGKNGMPSIIETSDGVQVKIKNQAAPTYSSAFVEVVGHAHGAEDGSFSYVEEFIARDFGDNFNLANYNKVVEFAAGPCADIFFDKPAQ